MIAVVLLVVGIPAAEAAPLVPSSDRPAASAIASRRRRSTASCNRTRRRGRSCSGTAVRAADGGERRDRGERGPVEVATATQPCRCHHPRKRMIQ